MTPSEVVDLLGIFLTFMGICSIPMLVNLRGAGPRYRTAVLRGLLIGWAGFALMMAWLVLGWFALGAGGRWFGLYRDFTLVLMGASCPLLLMGIRLGNRSLAAALAEDGRIRA